MENFLKLFKTRRANIDKATKSRIEISIHIYYKCDQLKKQDMYNM